jgi:hypothetical protein
MDPPTTAIPEDEPSYLGVVDLGLERLGLVESPLMVLVDGFESPILVLVDGFGSPIMVLVDGLGLPAVVDPGRG